MFCHLTNHQSKNNTAKLRPNFGCTFGNSRIETFLFYPLTWRISDIKYEAVQEPVSTPEGSEFFASDAGRAPSVIAKTHTEIVGPTQHLTISIIGIKVTIIKFFTHSFFIF